MSLTNDKGGDSTSHLHYNGAGIMIPCVRKRREVTRQNKLGHSNRISEIHNIKIGVINQNDKVETPTIAQPIVRQTSIRKTPIPENRIHVPKVLEDVVVIPKIPLEVCSPKYNTHIRSHDFDLSKFGQLRSVTSTKKTDNDSNNISLVVNEVSSAYPDLIIDEKHIDQAALNCLLIDKIKDLEKRIRKLES